MKFETINSLESETVACPICQQEFWGYSEIIFCSCGWTFIKEAKHTALAVQAEGQPENDMNQPRKMHLRAVAGGKDSIRPVISRSDKN